MRAEGKSPEAEAMGIGFLSVFIGVSRAKGLAYGLEMEKPPGVGRLLGVKSDCSV